MTTDEILKKYGYGPVTPEPQPTTEEILAKYGYKNNAIKETSAQNPPGGVSGSWNKPNILDSFMAGGSEAVNNYIANLMSLPENAGKSLKEVLPKKFGELLTTQSPIPALLQKTMPQIFGQPGSDVTKNTVEQLRKGASESRQLGQQGNPLAYQAGNFVGQTAADMTLLGPSGKIVSPVVGSLSKTIPALGNTPLAQKVLTGMLTAVPFEGAKKLIEEGRLPTNQELGTSMAFFGGAPLGESVVSAGAKKVLPNLSNLIKKPLEGAASGVTGLTAAALVGTPEDRKNLLKNLGPTAAAQALLHVTGNPKDLLLRNKVRQNVPKQMPLNQGKVSFESMQNIPENVQAKPLQNEKGILNQAANDQGMENSEEFKKWFEGSKVTNEKGEPLKVYHETRQLFDTFDKEKAGMNYDHITDGIFFTDSKEEANYYTEKIDNDRKVRIGDNPRVISSYLFMENPLILNSGEKDPTTYFDSRYDKIIRKIDEEGNYDGVIVKGNGPSLYWVSNSDQIKIIPESSGLKKKSGLNGNLENQGSFFESRNPSPNVENVTTRNIPQGENPFGKDNILPSQNATRFNNGGGSQSNESFNIGGENRPGNLVKNQERIEPSERTVSLTSVSQKYLSKSGLTPEEAYIAFEAKRMGKEQFKQEFSELENPEKAYNELTEKLNKLTPQEQKKVEFDLQFFAMREPEFNKKVQAQFISRFRTNSIDRAVNIPADVKEKLLVEDYGYDPQSSKDWLNNAKQNIANNKQAVIDRLMDTKAMLGGEQTAEAITLVEQMAKEAKTDADITKLNQFTQEVASKIRESARALKSVDTSLEKFGSPEGALIEGQRVVKKAQEEIEKADPIKKERIKKQTREIKDGLNQARKEAAQKTARELLTPEEKLANRVSTAFGKGGVPQRDPIQDMINELFKVAKESPLNKGKSPAPSPIEFLKQAIQNREQYQEVWDKAKIIVQEKFKDQPEALKLLDDYFKNPAKPEYSQSTLQRSINVSMKELEFKLEDLAKQFTGDREVGIKKVKEFLINETGAAGEEAKILAEQVYNKLTKNIEDKSHEILSRILKEPLKINKPVDTVKTIDDLAALGAFKNQYYKILTVSNKLPAKIRALLRENDINLGEIVKQSVSDIEFSKQKFLKNLLDRMNIQNNDASTIANECEKIFNELVAAKKKSTLDQMFKTREPGKKKSLTDKVIELVNLGAWDDAAIANILRENAKMPVLTNNDVKFIIDTMERSKTFPEGSRERQIEVAKVQKLIADKIPITLRDKFRGLQRIAMLSNPKTLVTRNPGSNVIWGGVSGLEENTIGAVVDFVTSGIRGSERTTVFDPIGKTTAYRKGVGKGFKEWVQDIGGGWENYKKLPQNATMKQRIEAYKKDRLNAVDTSPSRGQLELPKGRTFQSKTLNAIDDFVKNSLQLGDRPFYQGAYESRLYELKKIRKTDKVDEAMETEARLYALDKVFQNDSELAKAANGVRRDLKWIGDIAIPFTQTPANVLDKLLDHTPVALGKLLYHGFTTKGKGTFNQKYFTDTLTRFLSGSGIMLFGYAMASKGLITGKRDKNKRVTAFKQNVGISPYAFKLGDTYYTYDWNQPVGGMLASGADAFYGGQGKNDFVQSLTSGMISAGDTIFNQSFVQGLLRLMGGYSPTTNVIKTVVETPTQFAPTAGKQVAQLFDPYVRNTQDDNLLTQTGKKIVSKIPIASKTLPVKLDTFGQPIKVYQGNNNLWNVVFNPGFQTKFEKSPANKLIMDVYDKTGSTDIFPKVAPKDFTIAGQKYPLSTEEQTKFQKIMGEKILSSLNQFALISRGLSDDEKVKRIKRLIDKAYDEAKAQLIKNKNIKIKPKLSSRGSSSWG